MVYQNKSFSFKRKNQAKIVFQRDVERTVDIVKRNNTEAELG